MLYFLGVSMTDDKNYIIPHPELENPPAPEFPARGVAGLFSEDSLASLMARLTVLEALIKSLTRDYSFNDFSRELLLSVMRVIQSEAGTLFELDHKNNTLFFRASVGQGSDRLSQFRVPMGQGVVGHVAESRQPMLVSNVGESGIYLKAIQDAVGFKARNVIAIPIVVRARLFGVLELLNRIGEDNYTAADMELLTYLSEMLAKAIEIRMMIAWKNTSHAKHHNDKGGGAVPDAA